MMLGAWALASMFLVETHAAAWMLPTGPAAEPLVRRSADLAVAYWFFAATLILVGQRWIGRWAWTIACVAYLSHVVVAFVGYHGGAHSHAFDHVQEVSGFGPGIFVSYLFTLGWVADVLWWWFAPTSYDARPQWLDRTIHGVMAFIVFNGTVVYETGFIRWAGLAGFSLLGLVLLWRRNPRR